MTEFMALRLAMLRVRMKNQKEGVQMTYGEVLRAAQAEVEKDRERLAKQGALFTAK